MSRLALAALLFAAGPAVAGEQADHLACSISHITIHHIDDPNMANTISPEVKILCKNTDINPGTYLSIRVAPYGKGEAAFWLLFDGKPVLPGEIGCAIDEVEQPARREDGALICPLRPIRWYQRVGNWIWNR